MGENESLIPPATVVRERLARSTREQRLLRALLKLSIEADEVRQRAAGGPNANSRREAQPCGT